MLLPATVTGKNAIRHMTVAPIPNTISTHRLLMANMPEVGGERHQGPQDVDRGGMSRRRGIRLLATRRHRCCKAVDFVDGTI
jgi:hypothetical protein